MSDPVVRDVSLAEMLAAMDKSDDADVFRYFQTSYIGSDGRTYAGDTLRLTVGQLRKESGS